MADDEYIEVHPWMGPVHRSVLEAPIVNSVGCRWFGLEKADAHMRLTRQREFLEADPPIRPPTAEEVDSYGPDASIARWFISRWVANQATPYPGDLYLMDLDIHTLPPIPWNLAQVPRLHLARVSVKGISQDLMDRLETLTINDCRELEWLPEIPKKLYRTLAIGMCPKLQIHKFNPDLSSFFFSLYGGPPAFQEAQRPTVDALVDRINSHMRMLKLCRLISSLRHDIIAEAFKPSRIARRIDLYGIEAVVDSMDTE